MNFKVGMIFGCFDLFHDGHLTALLTASHMCDLLWIGVYSDEVIRTYKKRPAIIPQADRMRIMRYLYLHCAFQLRLIERREPLDLSFINVLFLGEQWRGRKFPLIDGTFKGEIVYIRRTPDISTTQIMQKCKKILDTA